MLVSIVIPTYNSLPKLKLALRSVEQIDFPLDSFEVLVVDDGSTDQTTEFLADYAESTNLNFSFFCQPNRGPAAARNLAIKNAKGDYVLSIDSDCYVHSNIIKEYLKHFPCEGLAGVGGTVLPEKSNYVSKYLEFRGTWSPGFDKDGVKYLITANAFLCKKAILDVGGFDEEYRYPGGEEVELCYRLRMKKYFFLFDKDATVVHAHRTTLRGLLRTYKTYGIGERISAEKWDSFRWPLRRLIRIIFGINALFFAARAIKSVNLYQAAYYSILEYLRLLSFAFGYYKK